MRFRRRKPRRTNSANRRRLFARHQRLGFEVLESRQLLAVDIMATKVDAPDNNPVLPGDNIRYTVDIQNNGDTDATNVVFSDTIDGNTTLVAGSVKVTPIAFDDSYSVTGNVTFEQDAAGGLLTNDFDPDGPGTPVLGTDLSINAVSVSKVSGTTTGDGTLTVAADGSFDYTPPAGETGNEQWQYTVSDGDGLDSNEVGVIDFSIDNFVWFVDNSVIGPGSGTQADPFDDFSSLNGSGGSGDVDSDGDIIFVFEGAGNYGSLALENNQQLVGEEAGLPLAGIAPGGRPTLTTTSNAIDLAQNNTITGLNLATTNSGIGIFGSTVGNLTISDVSISGTGQAVDIDNGTLDVTFDSVSSSGTSVGIDLSNTTGSFSVAGDGSATQGGNASGGTIDAVDIGVNLNNVAGVSLNNMLINGGHNDFAIRGTGVNGFTFDNSTISGTSGDNPGADEGAIKFTNLTGSASITQSVISGGIKNNLEIDNNTGTLDRLVIDRSQFTGHTGNDQDDGVTIEAAGSSVVSVTVIGSTFTAHKGDHFNYNMTGDSTGDLVFGTAASGNTLVGGHPSVLGGGITITGSGTGATPDLTFDIRNNDINGAVLQAINVNVLQNGTATDQADWSGTIDNNRIGTAGVFHSGSSTGNGLEVTANDKANMTVAITNNQIREFAQTGMRVLAGDATSGFGGGTTNATITGNQISKTVPQTPNDFVFGGISVESGSSSTAPDDHVMNVHVAGNNITIDDGGTFQFFPTFGIQVFERFSTVMELTQGGSGSTDSEQVLLDNNTITCPFCTNQTDDVEGPLDVDVVTTFPATPLVAAPAPSGDQLSVIGDQNDESAIHNPQSAIVSDDGILSSAELDFIVEAAKVRWTATGLSAEQSAAIDSVDFTVADMPGWYLGSFDGQTVRIDADAAGWGWYVDGTPLDDSEFVRPARQAGRGTNDGEGPARQAGPTGMDLLTAVMHEMGHIVGLNHNSDASDVMTASLTSGVRRIPAAGQADGATPFSAGQTEYIGAPIAIGTLAAGKSVTVTFDITVNAGVGSGTIISNQGNVTADGGIDVDTDDPAQGGAADPTTTTVGGGAVLPDLVGQTFDVNPSGSDTINAGDTITVDASVINSGTAAAGASSANVYLSTDANIDPATDPLILGGVGIAGLNPGLSGGFNNAAVSLPAAGDAFWSGDGTYYVGVVWDVNNDVAESNEGNNRNQGLGIDVDDITVNNTTLPPATIGNFVWDDLDADGIQDGGEPGIVGATVNLRNAADTMQLDTTTTGVGGVYSFTVAPGTYVVEFVAPGGFSFSPQDAGGDDTLDSDANPTTGRTAPVTVAAGENNDTIDAGLNTAPPQPADPDYVIEVVVGGNTVPNEATVFDLAQLNAKHIAVDSAGSVYIASAGRERVIKANPDGSFEVIAGGGTDADWDGTENATDLKLTFADSIALDAAGNVYFKDRDHIVKVNLDGTIDLVAGGGADTDWDGTETAFDLDIGSVGDIEVDAGGNIYFTHYFSNVRVVKVKPDGTIDLVAGGGSDTFWSGGENAADLSLHFPDGVAVDGAGNVYFADFGRDRVVRVKLDGTIDVVAGGGFDTDWDGTENATSLRLEAPHGVAVDGAGNVYFADSFRERVVRVKLDGTIDVVAGDGVDIEWDGTENAADLSLLSPIGVAVDGTGNVYFGDEGRERVVKVKLDGTIDILAGDLGDAVFDNGDLATDISLANPSAVALDGADNLYFADRGRVVKVNADQTINLVAGGGMDNNWDGSEIATDLSLVGTRGVAVDAAGNVYFSNNEVGNSRVVRVNVDGTIDVVAGGGADTVWDGTENGNDLSLFSTQGVAVDAAGNVFFAHVDIQPNDFIIKVNVDGTIDIVAGGGSDVSWDGTENAADLSLAAPEGVAVDDAGNVYFADRIRRRVVKVNPDGTIDIVAGGGTDTEWDGTENAADLALRKPEGVAVDSAGNVYFTDLERERVVRVNLDGTIEIVAGGGRDLIPIDGVLGKNLAVEPIFFGAGYIATDSSDRVVFSYPASSRILRAERERPAADVQIIDDGDLARFSAGGFTRLQSIRNPHGYVGDDGIMEEHYSQANSGNIATWTFTVTPGVYRVSANWVPHPNRATNSPFRVFDGPASGTPVAGRDINQQPAPDDFTDAGAPWEDIASQVAITGTTLTVTLADFPTNGFVIADAVRIERDLQPEIELTDLTTGNPIADGGTVAMGSVLMDVPTSRNIRISNLGSGDLNVSDVSLNNTTGSAFSLMPDPDPVGGTGTIAFGGSADFTIALDTSVNGTFAATVTVTSNDADEGTFTFDVTATVDTTLIVDDGDLLRFDAGGFTRLQSIRNPHGFVGDDGIMEEHYSEQNDGNTATWTFTVTPGMYRVSTNWTPHANRATNSPFAVFDGPAAGAPAETKSFSQRPAPDDFIDAGVPWEDIAIASIGGTTLTVALGDTPTDGFVIADAVRIERLMPLRAGEAVISDQSPVAGGQAVAGILDSSAVDVLFDQAVAEWSLVDATAANRLANVTVEVADLPHGVLGLASQSTSHIWLDTDAAGHGWDLGQKTRVKSQGPEGIISLTPSPHHFITPSSFSLLTVVTHELGHVLGLPDLDPIEHPYDVMAGRLGTGNRRLPIAAGLNNHESVTVLPDVRLGDLLFVGWEDPSREVDPSVYRKRTSGGSADPYRGADGDDYLSLAGIISRRFPDADAKRHADVVDRGRFGGDEEAVDELFAAIGEADELDSASE